MPTQTNNSQTHLQRVEAGKKAAATRKRNAARRSATATKRSATQTGRAAERSAKQTTRSATRSANGVGRQARSTARLGTTTIARQLDYATTRLDAVATATRRGFAIQVGAALEARDAAMRTAEFAVRTATRQRTLKRLERRGERALRRTEREVKRDLRQTERRVERTQRDVRHVISNGHL